VKFSPIWIAPDAAYLRGRIRLHVPDWGDLIVGQCRSTSLCLFIILRRETRIVGFDIFPIKFCPLGMMRRANVELRCEGDRRERFADEGQAANDHARQHEDGEVMVIDGLVKDTNSATTNSLGW
jgi:hypothetical protein